MVTFTGPETMKAFALSDLFIKGVDEIEVSSEGNIGMPVSVKGKALFRHSILSNSTWSHYT